MPIDSKECFTSLTTDGQLYEIYLAAQAGGSGNFVLKAGDTMTGKLNLPASLTLAPLNLGVGVTPTSSVAGDIFYDGTLKFKESTLIRTVAATEKSNQFVNYQSINATNNSNPTLAVLQGGGGGALKIINLGSGESLRIEDESPESSPFVVSASGRVGIGVTPDTTVALKVDSTGIKFNDNTIQTTAAVAGVTSVSATSPITSTGGTTPVISTSMATNKLLGRSTAGIGAAEEISIGTGLSLTAGTLSNAGVLSDTTAAQGGTQLLNMVQITQAAYSAIVTPTANTLYIIVG